MRLACYNSRMIEHYVGPRREPPQHAPAQLSAATQDTLQNKDMQQDTGGAVDAPLHAIPSPEEFTISVEQVREHFRAKGLSKSKDTVQRWCRTGELACKKRGVLNRYFTTEVSLLELERKLLPDMIAENAGGKKPEYTDAQFDAAANAATETSMQLHEAEDAGASSGTQSDKEMPVQLHAPERVDRQPDSEEIQASLARLTAENEGLRAQLENRDSQIDFLQEEIRSAREQRGSVVQISNRMLETLETMAIGGRLERPKPSEPVRYEDTNNASDRV